MINLIRRIFGRPRKWRSLMHVPRNVVVRNGFGDICMDIGGWAVYERTETDTEVTLTKTDANPYGRPPYVRIGERASL